MVIILAVECDGCEYQHQVVRRTSPTYELDDGTEFPLVAAVGWCRECQHVVEVEVLPDKEYVEDYVAKLKASDPEVVESLVESGRQIEDEVEYQEEVLTWLRGRKSPARCLECGGHAFDRFPVVGEEGEEEDSRAIPHPVPGCEGNLKIVGPGITRGGAGLQEFDSEGELIEYE